MSQIIIIERVAALAEQIEQTYLHHGSMKIKQAVLVCLHPIEVPDDAEELAIQIQRRDNDENPQLTVDEAAALVTAHSRMVPRAMLDEIWLIGNRSKPGQKEVDTAEITAKYGYRAE